ncbi:MAG TPA: hypothetical protein VNM67_10845 [Thermoanaerobaculia bacterium]|jgi:hypothetical protein|nr:hypothetical protein [Thermoanaerobaculia bacterium]
MATFLRRLYDAVLRHRVAICLSLGLLLLLPSLSGGFYFDDLWHQALLDAHARGQDGGSTLELCLDLWSWDTGLPGRSYLRIGSPYLLTWFADLDLSVRWFRPLTAWTLLANHRLGGSDPFGYHVTNLALWLLLAAAALELHRRLLPAPGARPALLLAGLFFVLSDTHQNNVVWISGRHGLLDTLFSLVCILLYDRFRHRGGLRNLVLAVVALALGLAAGEMALLTLVWIAAYEVFLSHDPPRLRIACASPFFLLAAGYLVFYVSAGYGAYSSSWYLNPVDRPLDFLRAALTQRLPGYLIGALTVLPGEIFQANSPLVMALGLALLLIVAAVLLPSLRWRPEMRFAAAASLGSMLFLCMVPPFSYKLMLPSAAVSLMLALGVTDTLRRLRNRPSIAKRGALGVLLLMHGIGAPLLGNYLLRDFVRASRPENRLALWRSIEWPQDREVSEVYLINTPGSWTGLFLPYEDYRFTGRWVGNYFPVSFQSVSFDMTRLDPDTVRLRAPEGFLSGYFAQGLAALVRRDPAIRAGEDFAREGFTVVVDQARNGVPMGLLVRFPRNLDDERVHLLAFDGTRTRRIRAPRIGETLSIRVATPR